MTSGRKSGEVNIQNGPFAGGVNRLDSQHCRPHGLIRAVLRPNANPLQSAVDNMLTVHHLNLKLDLNLGVVFKRGSRDSPEVKECDVNQTVVSR